MFSDVFRHEWRLFSRNRAVPAIASIYAVVLAILSVDLLKSGPAHFFGQWRLYNIFAVLAMLFLGAQYVQRDENVRFAEILASLPVKSHALLLGRLAVGGIIVTAAAVAQAVAGAVAAAIQQVPLALFARGWVAVWPVTLLIFACALLAGYVIALLAGRRAGLLAIGIYWLVPLFAMMFFSSISAMMHTLLILDMSGVWGIVPTDMWGIGPDAGLWTLRLLFLIAFALLCLTTAIAAHERRRPSGLPRRAMAAVSVALVVVLAVTTAGYGAIYHTRVMLSEGRDPGPEVDTRSAFVVDDYDLDATLRDARLAMVAALTLTNDGDSPEARLLLTLRASLTVGEAAWNGAAVSVTRAGNYLTIDLPRPVAPRESGVLSITYVGPVTDWDIAARANVDANLRFGIGKGYAYLPYPAAWYPVAGHLRCAPPARPRTGMIPHAPARFSLSVSSNGLALASNLPAAGDGHFAGDGYTGVCLLAAPTLREVAGDGYRFVHNTGPTKAIRKNMETVRGLVDDACACLPVTAPRRVELLALPSPFANADIPVVPPGPDGTITLAVPETWVGITDVHPSVVFDTSLLSRLVAWTISPGLGMDDSNISGAVGTWLSLRLGAASMGVTYGDAMKAFAPESTQPSPDGLIAVLDARWRAGGATAVREALIPLVDDPNMSLPDFLATLQEGGGR